MNTSPEIAQAKSGKASGYKWELLGLFWLANFLNQGDRQIYSSILPLIKRGIGADDVHMGFVAMVFTLTYGFLVPIAGWLGDRTSRKWIVSVSLLTFSIGTLCTGFSGGILSLILFRCVATGAGESFYTPSALSLLGQHHQQTRGLAMSVNQTANYVGVVASSWLAGVVAEHYGWRHAFFIFGGFGLFLAVLLIARVRNDPPQGNTEKSNEGPKLKEVLGVVCRTPTVWLLALGFAFMAFGMSGISTWGPTLLFEKYGLSISGAAFHAVFLHNLFAFFGVLAGGAISDRYAVRKPVVRLYCGCLGLLLSVPFIWGVGMGGNLRVVIFCLAAFGFFRGIYDSSIFSSLFEVVSPRYRASAVGLMISFAYAIGAMAPLALGYIKKYSTLDLGLALMAPVYLLGAIIIWAAARFSFQKDHALVHEETTA